MRAYTIKHKGKTILQNMIFNRELVFSDRDEVYAGLLFFRKKDAKKYLASMPYPEYLEVVGMTIDKCKQDNRFK